MCHDNSPDQVCGNPIAWYRTNRGKKVSFCAQTKANVLYVLFRHRRALPPPSEPFSRLPRALDDLRARCNLAHGDEFAALVHPHFDRLVVYLVARWATGAAGLISVDRATDERVWDPEITSRHFATPADVGAWMASLGRPAAVPTASTVLTVPTMQAVPPPKPTVPTAPLVSSTAPPSPSPPTSRSTHEADQTCGLETSRWKNNNPFRRRSQLAAEPKTTQQTAPSPVLPTGYAALAAWAAYEPEPPQHQQRPPSEPLITITTPTPSDDPFFLGRADTRSAAAAPVLCPTTPPSTASPTTPRPTTPPATDFWPLSDALPGAGSVLGADSVLGSTAPATEYWPPVSPGMDGPSVAGPAGSVFSTATEYWPAPSRPAPAPASASASSWQWPRPPQTPRAIRNTAAEYWTSPSRDRNQARPASASSSQYPQPPQSPRAIRFHQSLQNVAIARRLAVDAEIAAEMAAFGVDGDDDEEDD